jgi:hypothetical protein
MSSDLSPEEIWQSDHSRDSQMIQRFIAERPDVVSSIRTNFGPPARHEVLIWGANTRDVRNEIHASLEFPDDVTFFPATFSPAYLCSVLEEIDHLAKELPRPSFQTYGPTWDGIFVQLDASLEALAASLHERFGDALILTVGNFPYPMDRPLTFLEDLVKKSRSAAVPNPPVVPDLEARLIVPSLIITSGSGFDAEVVITNVGSTPVEYAGGAPNVSILDPATHEVVGGFQGSVAGVGILLSLAPGESSTLKALTGTTSTRRELGYVVPPGRYLARASLQLSPWHGPASQGGSVVNTPEVEIEMRTSTGDDG